MGDVNMWQEAGVVLLVGGAVYYLVRTLFGSPPSRTTTSFVPLKDLRKQKKQR
jgi:hypothetical protein